VKITVNSPSETKRELLIEVPAEILDEAVKKETEKVRKRVQISGFRKGKAPLQMIRAQYGTQIDATAIEDTINEQYRLALEQEKLNPLAPAEISDMDYNPGQPLKFKATIEIEPEITVTEWDKMTVEKEEVEVTEELVDETLGKIRYRYATSEVKEEPAAEGDQVLADITEVDPATGVEIIGKKYPDRSLRIGEQTYGPDFDEALIGMKEGQGKIVKRPLEQLMIVDPNQDKNKGPREEAFRITVKKVEEVTLPELDDELAKEMKYDDFDALRNGVRENLKRQLEDSARDNFRSNLEREAVRIADPPAPEAMVERYLDNLIETFKRMSNRPMDLNKLREESKDTARKKVQWFLIREYLIKEEAIKVTEEEIDEYLKKAAEDNNMDFERLRLEYRSGEKRENLRNELTDQKVYDFLEGKAEVRTVKKQKLDEAGGAVA